MRQYKPYASSAQQRLFHAKAERGEISRAEIKGKDKATDFSNLPDYTKGTKKTVRKGAV